MRELLCVAGAVVLTSAPTRVARAEPSPPVLAIFGIEDGRSSRRLDSRALDALTEYLASRLASGGAFQLVPPADLQRALTQRKTDSYKACYDESCQIEIGKELAAQQTLSTKITRLGKKCLVTATLYDLVTSTTKASANHRGACTEEALVEAIDDVAAQLRGGRVQGFGKGLGRFIKVKSAAKLDLQLGTTSFADLDTTYLEIVQNAKRAEEDKSLPASKKAAAWSKVVRFKGRNPLKSQARDREAHWREVEALRLRFEADHAKLTKLLSFDDEVFPKAQKIAAQKEMDQIYALYRELLAASGSKVYAEIEKKEADRKRREAEQQRILAEQAERSRRVVCGQARADLSKWRGILERDMSKPIKCRRPCLDGSYNCSMNAPSQVAACEQSVRKSREKRRRELEAIIERVRAGVAEHRCGI